MKLIKVFILTLTIYVDIQFHSYNYNIIYSRGSLSNKYIFRARIESHLLHLSLLLASALYIYVYIRVRDGGSFQLQRARQIIASVTCNFPFNQRTPARQFI